MFSRRIMGALGRGREGGGGEGGVMVVRRGEGNAGSGGWCTEIGIGIGKKDSGPW